MYSLRTLFIVVAVAALGAGALFANAFWLISAFVVLTLGILCWAFLQRHEALWRGLFVFGTAYLLCAVLPFSNAISEALPSTRIHTFGDRPQFQNSYGVNEIRSDRLIGMHCVAALLFGAAGGLLLQWNARRGKGDA